ncbi:MAG: hypothetical protein JWN10_101, partial [Solirubrobacterales bacterium]|nr:hypothetical protein [Solirubrobacterales bacterium]
GWLLRFEMNIAAQAVNINWWGMKGEVIGSFLGGGITLAAGIFGGQGSISQQ